MNERIPNVSHDHQHIGHLAHSPQLTPNFQVLLEEAETGTVLSSGRVDGIGPGLEVASFGCFYFVPGHFIGPAGSNGNGKGRTFSAKDAFETGTSPGLGMLVAVSESILPCLPGLPLQWGSGREDCLLPTAAGHPEHPNST